MTIVMICKRFASEVPVDTFARRGPFFVSLSTLAISLLLLAPPETNAAPSGNRSCEGRLSKKTAAQNDFLKDLPSIFRRGLYSFGAFKFEDKFLPTGTLTHDFAGAVKISDVSDKKGNVVLFRGIFGAPKKAFVDGPCIADQGRAYSYSISPSAALRWINGALPARGFRRLYTREKYIVISLQNVQSDRLTYKFHRLFRPGIDPEPTTGTKLTIERNFAKGFDSAFSIMNLTESTEIAQLGKFGEVIVPINIERTLGAIPAADFEELINEYGGQPFSQEEFLAKLFSHASFKPLVQLDP